MATKKNIKAKFEAKDHSEYWNSDFQDILNETTSTNYDVLSKNLQTDVEFLSRNFSRANEQMTEWLGTASTSTREAFKTISDKFDCTMDNIIDTIGPSCQEIENFKQLLEKLKKGKEELTGEDGNGGLDWQLREANKDYNEKKNNYDSIMSNKPLPKIKVIDSDGVHYNDNSVAVNNWKMRKSIAESLMNAAADLIIKIQEKIKAKEEEVEQLLEQSKQSYELIEKLISSVKSFAEHFRSGVDTTSAEDFVRYFDQMIDSLNQLTTDYYSKKSLPVLADESFFEEMCRQHADEGWKIENNIVTMYIDGKECTYNIKNHLFSDGGTWANNKKVQLEAYFYLPSHIVESGDYSSLENLNTYTFFSSKQSKYVDTINSKEINTFTIKIIKQDPLTDKYGTVASITKAANKMANTNLDRCHNAIGGDSVYGAHSLKIAAATEDLYDTVYCIDNAAIVTGENGKAGTKEQFSSLDELKKLDGKNIYFINTSGDDNYSYYADMSIERGRAYVPVGSHGTVTAEQFRKSFTYTGIALVADNCPNAKIHIVYQCKETAKDYQMEIFPKELDELANSKPNVWNDSENWGNYADNLYKTHSDGNYVQHDLAGKESTYLPNLF